MDLETFKSYIRSLSFIPDKKGIEQFRAPWLVDEMNGGDCDDIAIMVAFWVKLKRGKMQFSLWGKNNEILHIATRIKGRRFDELIDFHGAKDWTPIYIDHWRR